VVIGLCMLSTAAQAQQPSARAPAANPESANSSPVNARSVHQEYVRQEYVRGQALFSGSIELHGRIYTHAADMPPNVVRCSNCHALAEGPDVPRSPAPRLTHNLLLLPQPRRGGPPTTYSRDSFCTLLRRGVDPAFVMISVQMPRYTMDDEGCKALWRYLIGSGGRE
jgi:hypothetical protein